MTTATGMERNRVEWEVDRYISQPAQTLTCMIGQLKIVELRDKAKQALGSRFDIRRFHVAVLDQGQLPLDLLERVVEEWVAGELQKRQLRSASCFRVLPMEAAITIGSAQNGYLRISHAANSAVEVSAVVLKRRIYRKVKHA